MSLIIFSRSAVGLYDRCQQNEDQIVEFHYEFIHTFKYSILIFYHVGLNINNLIMKYTISSLCVNGHTGDLRQRYLSEWFRTGMQLVFRKRVHVLLFENNIISEHRQNMRFLLLISAYGINTLLTGGCGDRPAVDIQRARCHCRACGVQLVIVWCTEE